MQLSYLIRIVLLVILSVLLSSCDGDSIDNFSESKNLNQELRLQKVDTFELQKEDSLSDRKIGQIREYLLKKHPSENIYAFYDKIFKQFLISRGSKIFSIIGGKGRGPKEFVDISSYNFDEEGNLVVHDNGLGLIKTFDLSGELIHTTKVQPSKKFAIIGQYLYTFQGQYVFGILQHEYLSNLDEAWNSSLAGFYSKEGKITESFGVYDPYIKSIKHYDVYSVINVDRDNSILLSTQGTIYRIQMYDLNTKERIAYFGYKSSNFKEIDEEIDSHEPLSIRKEKSINQSFTSGVYFTSKYVILAFQNLSMEWFTSSDPRTKQYYIAVYDRETKDFLDELLLPYPLANIMDGRLYLLENDNPVEYTLGIYELEK